MMPDGLVKVPAPALPNGHQIKCVWCRCTVTTSHVPGSFDCLQAGDERTISQTADPW